MDDFEKQGLAATELALAIAQEWMTTAQEKHGASSLAAALAAEIIMCRLEESRSTEDRALIRDLLHEAVSRYILIRSSPPVTTNEIGEA